MCLRVVTWRKRGQGWWGHRTGSYCYGICGPEQRWWVLEMLRGQTKRDPMTGWRWDGWLLVIQDPEFKMSPSTVYSFYPEAALAPKASRRIFKYPGMTVPACPIYLCDLSSPTFLCSGPCGFSMGTLHEFLWLILASKPLFTLIIVPLPYAVIHLPCLPKIFPIFSLKRALVPLHPHFHLPSLSSTLFT